ncbi:MAG: phosphoribosylformylglycinamidine synthase subunit PurQ [Acidobacteria bacterium]|nr:MAG: phosphoribosylformylglycinamidine synthase subunit PurQ [Acidobacteriota bacterium]TDI42359.1 MAG: phosphoribosylformylglycinamidine synthase subunit PurQ [Acidobacteriota bacterium]
MKLAVIVFPGSNCEHDVHHVLKELLQVDVQFVWHQTEDLSGFDGVVLPGGFSYGDYLRSGAMAGRSPVLNGVRRLAADGIPVLGICNGFQILCECGLLPGALLRNSGLRFLCRQVAMRVEQTGTPFTGLYREGQQVEMPVANFDGNYFAGAEDLERLEGEGRVVFRYLDNPNGSAHDIAGIVNQRRNILGIMPHPERVCDELLGGSDGLSLFKAMAGHLVGA